MLALAVLVVAAAAVLLVWRPWASGESAPAPAATESAPTESPAPEAPEEEPSETPTPSETQPFTPIGGDPDVHSSEPCAPEQIRLTPETDRSAYVDGEPVRLSFTIENTGDAPCTINAGTSVQEYEIRTGDELVYRWSDCAADVADDVVALDPGTPQSTVPIEWDRTRSSVETCGAEREPVTADGAAYNLSVRVGEFSSRESRQFILE